MPADEKQLDPRVVRTRKLLREAFMDLVAEKGYRNITIQELTDRATLNRVTFYLHYDNLEDLLIQTTHHLLDELVARVPPRKEGGGSYQKVLDGLAINFQFFADYQDFMRSMLGPEGVWTFLHTWQEYHFQAGINRLRELHKGNPELEIEPELVSRYMHASFTGVLQWWFETDMSSSPQELAAKVLKIYTEGVYRTLGYTITDQGFFVE